MRNSDMILSLDTVSLDDEGGAVVIIDQTKLPGEAALMRLQTPEQLFDAIKRLCVRGAPAIGVAAAFGLYLAAKKLDTSDFDEFRREVLKTGEYLRSARPTAVNLSWALSRMERRLCASCSADQAKAALLSESNDIFSEDIRVCRAIGEHSLTLLSPGDGILTHCNAGRLATIRYGTATSVMYLGHERGYGLRIFADETRPLLQGARLTAFELKSAGIDVTLICDGMAATVMKSGLINAVFVGCDRVAANGDAANKIGTLSVAIAAKRYGIPFYVCAPTSTLDLEIKTGSGIVIEERDAEEVTDMWYRGRMAPDGVKVFNPAFDVTDSDLITAIITEHGVARPPFDAALRGMIEKTRIERV